jgi:hypothetical protein
MKHYVLLSLAALIAHGCSPTAEDGTDTGQPAPGGDASGPSANDPPPEEVEATALFEVVGEPFDLTVAPDGRIFVSIAEHAIDVWDPSTEWVETHTDNLGAVFGIVWSEDTIFYSVSNHRQSGALMKLDGRTGAVIADAAGPTIFREPRDLCLAADGSWVLADKTLGALFVVREGGESVEQLGVPLDEPSTLAADSDYVYAGGEGGVLRIPWPGGEPEQIDARPVNGLHVAGDTLWGTNAEWGVFAVGTDVRLSLPGVRRPGRMAGSDPLLVSDWGGGGVWAASLTGVE